MRSDIEDLLGKTPVQDKGERTGEFGKNLQIKMLRSAAIKKRKKEEGLGRKSYALKSTFQTDLDKAGEEGRVGALNSNTSITFIDWL